MNSETRKTSLAWVGRLFLCLMLLWLAAPPAAQAHDDYYRRGGYSREYRQHYHHDRGYHRGQGYYYYHRGPGGYYNYHGAPRTDPLIRVIPRLLDPLGLFIR